VIVSIILPRLPYFFINY